jgi:hypothetical protein
MIIATDFRLRSTLSGRSVVCGSATSQSRTKGGDEVAVNLYTVWILVANYDVKSASDSWQSFEVAAYYRTDLNLIKK